MELSSLESDLIGDLAQDSHGLWEIFEFIKLHHPESSEQAIFNRGREIIASWLARGWLSLPADPKLRGGVTSENELLSLINHLGKKVMVASDELPWVDLSEKAFHDVVWLRKKT